MNTVISLTCPKQEIFFGETQRFTLEGLATHEQLEALRQAMQYPHDPIEISPLVLDLKTVPGKTVEVYLCDFGTSTTARSPLFEVKLNLLTKVLLK